MRCEQLCGNGPSDLSGSGGGILSARGARQVDHFNVSHSLTHYTPQVLKMQKRTSTILEGSIRNMDLGHAQYPDGTTQPLEICESCISVMASPESLARLISRSQTGQGTGEVSSGSEPSTCFFRSIALASIEAFNNLAWAQEDSRRSIGPGEARKKWHLQHKH